MTEAQVSKKALEMQELNILLDAFLAKHGNAEMKKMTPESSCRKLSGQVCGPGKTMRCDLRRSDLDEIYQSRF